MEARTIEKDLDWLRQRSDEVLLDDKELGKDIETLRDYSLNHGVLAMAAIQLGIKKRLIYIKNTDVDNLTARDVDECIVLINPVIESMEGITGFWEACASCLDNMGFLYRPYKVVIKYNDIDGNDLSRTFEGFPATVFCHEYDHLDGILHMDKSLESYDMDPDAREVFRETHKYDIFEKDGDFKELDKIYRKNYK
jgi:peptide deformylase